MGKPGTTAEGQQAENARSSRKPAPLISAASGAMSGSLISACVQPLDVLRTKMQGDAARGVHKGSLKTVAAIVKQNGVRGMWQGTGPSVWRVGLGAGLHFVLLEQLRGLLSTKTAEGKQHLSATNAALSGGLSRAIASMALCPLTVIKTRMEYTSPDPTLPRYRNTLGALMTISKTEGPRGLFKGMLPTVLTNAPFSALYYMFYSGLKERLTGPERPQTVVNFSSGVAAAIAATMLTQPFDVVRTRMQLGMSGVAASMNSLETLAAITKNQGPKALLTGFAPRVMKRTTQTALVWTLYEELVPSLTKAASFAMASIPKPLPQKQDEERHQDQGKGRHLLEDFSEQLQQQQQAGSGAGPTGNTHAGSLVGEGVGKAGGKTSEANQNKR